MEASRVVLEDKARNMTLTGRNAYDVRRHLWPLGASALLGHMKESLSRSDTSEKALM